MNKNIEYRTLESPIEITENNISGRAIVFNSESQFMGFYETISPEAVTQELIDRSNILCLFNHETSKVLARSRYGKGSLKLELRSDGLYYKFSVPNTQLGKDLVEYLKRGEIFGSSFGFTLPNDGSGDIVTRDKDNVLHRTITKIDKLWDVSPCFEPAYLATTCSQRMLELLNENKSEDIRMNEEKINQLEENIELVENLEENREKEDISEEKVEEIHEKSDVKEDEKDEKSDVKEEEKEEEKSEEKPDEKQDEKDIEEDKEDKKDSSSNERALQISEIEQENTKTKINKNKKDNNIIMKNNFSLLRAINDIANGKQLDPVNAEVVSLAQSEMRNAGMAFNGQIQVPYEERATITVNVEGEDVVATDVWNIMDPLRAKNVLAEAGAQIYTGLVNNVKIPILSKSQVSWEGETAPAKDASAAFTHVELSPKRLTAYMDISKQFLIQTDNLQAEAKLRNDLIAAVTSKLEETVLGSEAGTTTQPAGIFNGATVLDVSTFKNITDLEADIEIENVYGELKYVMDPKAKAALRNMPRSEDHTRLVMENGEVDGTPALVTSNIAEKKLVVGDWSNLIIGQWGGLDLTVDAFTQAINGCVRLVINAYFDAKVARPEAFAFGQISE